MAFGVPRKPGPLVVALVFVAAMAAPVAAAWLSPEAIAGWTSYIAATDQRIGRELGSRDRFLAQDFRPDAGANRAAVLAGTIAIDPMVTTDARGAEMDVPYAMVHHWRGAVLIPGVRLDDLLKQLQSGAPGAKQQEDVLQSRVLERGPDRMRIFLRLQRTKFVTVVYNTEHLVLFKRHSAARASSASTATKIAEIQSPGTPAERELPIGQRPRLLVAVERVLALRTSAGRGHRRVRVGLPQPRHPLRRPLRGVVAHREHGVRVDGAHAGDAAGTIQESVMEASPNAARVVAGSMTVNDKSTTTPAAIEHCRQLRGRRLDEREPCREERGDERRIGDPQPRRGPPALVRPLGRIGAHREPQVHAQDRRGQRRDEPAQKQEETGPSADRLSGEPQRDEQETVPCARRRLVKLPPPHGSAAGRLPRGIVRPLPHCRMAQSPISPFRAWSIALTMSWAEANRAAGTLLRHVRTMPSRAPSVAAPDAGGVTSRLRRAGSSSRILAIVDAASDPVNGCVPDTHSYSIVPNENRSDRASTVSPRICSGDM